MTWEKGRGGGSFSLGVFPILLGEGKCTREGGLLLFLLDEGRR